MRAFGPVATRDVERDGVSLGYEVFGRGPGNGSSDRVTDPNRYSPEAYAEDAVLEAEAASPTPVVGCFRSKAPGTSQTSETR